ncbi:XPO6 [Bugula neritina]|uniref:XPO6 n=1 Tax=Bugula neritina TaxID=10212 RepID=A0A7J7JNW5_BUGNE|nr:XPO6 [Bugula neritina]
MPFDKSSHMLCTQALTCLGHLFSWIPLSTMITSNLLNTIFSFAAFGCESHHTVSTSSQGQSLGMLAMCCINELLNKNCVPADFESYLLQLFQQTFYLLKKLTKGTKKNLENLDSSFLDKFTEFIQLFVNNHLRRFESNPNFPVLEFLSLLFEYTFKPSSTDEFFACLNIWQIFIDYIKSQTRDRTSKYSSMEKYFDGIMALVRELLNKVQFKHNAEQLEELDSESLDDDGMTEMQIFISHCNDTLIPIAELVLNDVIQLVDQLFNENLQLYLNLEVFLNDPRQHTPQVASKVHHCLKDLCALMQTSARMVEYFSGSAFEDKFAQTERSIKRVAELAIYNEKMKFYSRHYTSEMVKKLICSHFGHFEGLYPWIAQYYIESYHKEKGRDQCASLVTTIINCAASTVDHTSPTKILEWTVQLIHSILVTVRPVYLYDVPSVQQLYSKVTQGYASSLPSKTSNMLLSCLSSYLILRWPALPDSEQKWEMRTANHSAYISSLQSQFLQLKDLSSLTSNSSTAFQAKEVVLKALPSLHELIMSVNEEPKKTKDIMYNSTKEYIQLSLQLFSVYISQPDVLEKIVEFFLVLIRSLRVQMGVTVTQQTIQTFIDLFTKERIMEILNQENQTAYRIIESFLKMLELIVQEQAAAFKALLPNIISICMEHVYPLVAPKPSPEIKMTLYEVLFEILDKNWKFFYKSPVIYSFGDVKPSEPLSHQPEFIAILHAFGQSFLQSDISVFRHNLEALEKLHKKWKLYQKTIFVETMMSQFLNVLLQVLVVRSHDLLQEDIVNAVYNMASVDFALFYNKFIPAFLQEVNTIDYHQKETLKRNLNPEHKDLPSFTANIHRMVNDLRYYTIVNASLPPGTIDLSQKEPEPISEY